MPIVHNYLKARFVDAVAASQAAPQIAGLMQQGQQARAFWMNHRCMEKQGRRWEFWSQFQTSFPEVYVCLGALVGGNCDEALLGFLEFGKPEGIELYAEDQYVCLKAADLWCGADWDLLAVYLKTCCGALNAVWIGDEPLDYFALLDP